MINYLLYRDYRLTDYELCMFTSNLCLYLERDLADLVEFGITQQKIDELRTLGNEFEVYPNDDAYLGDVMTAIDNREAKMEEVKENIRNMALRFELKWTSDSGIYKSLGIKKMNNFLEDKLLTTARRVHELAADNLAGLADYGLTQTILDSMAAANEALELAMIEVKTKKAERDKKTKERIEKGNEIYKLVRAYCEIGKRIYMKSSPAQYANYIIYASSAKLPRKVQGLVYDINSGVLTWTAEPEAENYEVQFAAENPKQAFKTVYEGEDNNCMYNPNIEGNFKFRVRGKIPNGSGTWSDVLIVIRN